MENYRKLKAQLIKAQEFLNASPLDRGHKLDVSILLDIAEDCTIVDLNHNGIVFFSACDKGTEIEIIDQICENIYNEIFTRSICDLTAIYSQNNASNLEGSPYLSGH